MLPARLIVANVWTEVQADEAAYQMLDRKLRYWVKGAERRWEFKQRRWDGYHYTFTGNHKFRTGLLRFVKSELKRAGYNVTVEDARTRPYYTLKPINLRDLTARDYQLDAVAAAVEAGRGTIYHGTGAGKTEVMAQLIQTLDLPTLMLVNQQTIAVQTSERLAYRMGRAIGLMAAGKNIDGDIVCATFQSVGAKMRVNPDAALKWLGKFDILVVDEAHHLVAESYQRIADKVPAYFRFAFSATPFKSKGSTGDNEDEAAVLHVVGTCGPVLHEFKAGDLVQEGYLTPAHIIMRNWRKPTIWPTWKLERIDYDLNDDYYDYTGRKATKGRSARDGLYKLAIIENDDRNAAIVREVAELVKAKLPTLVLVDKVSHGEILKAMLRTHFDSNRMVDFISGRDPNDRRKKKLAALADGTLPVLIASTIVDEGVDVPAIGALVFAGGQKAQHKYIQRIGRGMRLAEGKNELEVRDFYDTHSKLMWMHSEKRRKAYESDPAGYRVEVKS